MMHQKIAIEGCCHGELDKIYNAVREEEARYGQKVDLVLICGDFQALRNESDLACMAVPDKFKTMGTFWKYYSGQARAPYPTIFIGGNHEASNYLWELYHGGWVCDNIYYLGCAGVINFGGLRIGGLSGIYKQNDYHIGHHETVPYNSSEMRSIYHVREYDVRKLLQVQEPIDIFLSHDWPKGIERYGDVLSNSLGSSPNEVLLYNLKPARWFAAHLHVRYEAEINHEKKDEYSVSARELLGRKGANKIRNSDEIQIDDDSEDINAVSSSSPTNDVDNSKVVSKTTKFLSLDKCLPRRQFLEIVNIPSPNDENGDYDFYYDMEWLSITKAMNNYLSISRAQTAIPSDKVLKEAIEKERHLLEEQRKCGILDLKIPHNFEPTAPVPLIIIPSSNNRSNIYLYKKLEHAFLNPQTTLFCNSIGIENKINVPEQHFSQANTSLKSIPVQSSSSNEPETKRIKTQEPIQSEIVIDEDEFF
ncbi:hypothetical protein G6F55_012184 [Rhizopus delemar]|uniref:Lariat debranching enzyme C-terminal domain-containing protein n=2 Tax=Rhizopus TaxID=4842 RepID=A0A9P6YR96_9FUNG|nr:hypothetical protein G6F55_012184 [Rhizopus delemar]KAG1509785.1 hypothetical protein G6F52_011061 [Rhizopus delemar]KAG1538965.1 hypothetical protein G6F51_009436 [Rhizopus arrhizus]KAG1560056.1 hypothetical protein G6F50_012347 [Rhizopus delemar]KAG1617511.1 hypothetical protein G6F45_012106 [Rhizopus arrhizus]